MQQQPSQDVVLKAQDIHKSFGPTEVLKGISLEARNHDVISILGASGSGKSTFLRCLNFLEVPTSGTVRIHGDQIEVRKDRPANQRQIEQLRQRLGMVFQQFNLWSHRTVLENVMEGPVQVKRHSKAEARDQAEALLTPRWPSGPHEHVSLPAFRRPAATRCHCPGACDGARCHPV